MDPYTYSALLPGEIRLLKLLPASDEHDQIHCEINHVTLQFAPEYEAISYEWKSIQGTAAVRATTGLLNISKSLEYALRSMREEHTPRMLWADGICVNQNDEQEVTCQLALMDRIYERSFATLVWLGCSNGQTAKAIRILQSLALLARQRNAIAGMEGNLFMEFMIKSRPKYSSVFIDNRDMILQEFKREHGFTSKVLLRHPKMSDDEIFDFDSYELWCEIDELFSSSFFERTWIEREVAKAPYVQLHRGQYTIPWPIFTSALVGRSILGFHKHHPRDYSLGPVWNVIDARERWRTLEHRTTLAGALVALSYSKETNIRDHIYAAYTLSKCTIPWLQKNDYDIDVKELMWKTACACIEERRDLYHLGQWCITSRKTMNLPTWVPEFTAGICELAVQHASRITGGLVDGSYNICGKLLCLNVHLLDTIEWTHDIKDHGDLHSIFKIVQYLDQLFRENDECGLFGSYAASREGWIARKSAAMIKRETVRQLSEAEAIFEKICWYPKAHLEHLRYAQRLVEQDMMPAYSDNQVIMEALWALLNPSSPTLKRTPAPAGERLFLAWLYLMSLQTQKHEGVSIETASLPQAYGSFLLAILPVVTYGNTGADAKEVIAWTSKFISGHSLKTSISLCETECVFVTRKGFLGRTVAGEACKGDMIAFLGGGWTPYILERSAHFYKVKSFAYIEGVEKIAKLPAHCRIGRICLE